MPPVWPRSGFQVFRAVFFAGLLFVFLNRALADQIMYDYDSAGRLEAVACNSGDAVFRINYAYDASANLLSKENRSQITDWDGDLMPDAWEDAHGLDSANPADALADPDHDCLSNLEEYEYGTDPNARDTDGDRASDYREISQRTDPNDPGHLCG